MGCVCSDLENPVCLAEEMAAESALPSEYPGATGINGEETLAFSAQGKCFLPRPGSHSGSASAAGARLEHVSSRQKHGATFKIWRQTLTSADIGSSTG